MTTLPSFVELMTTLGINPPNGSSQDTSSPESASHSSPSSPRANRLALPASSPTRSRSSPSLRDYAARSRMTRYSPYSPTLVSNVHTAFPSPSHPVPVVDINYAYPTPGKRIVRVFHLFILVRKVLSGVWLRLLRFQVVTNLFLITFRSPALTPLVRRHPLECEEKPRGIS